MKGRGENKKDQKDKLEIKKGVSLIDFNASWCAPCREQQPILEKLATRFEGRAIVSDLDVDEHPDSAMALGITSLPTLIIFKDGNEYHRFIGIQSEETLMQSLEQALANKLNR